MAADDRPRTTASALAGAVCAVVLLGGCGASPPGEPSPTHDVAPLHRQWIDEETARSDSDLFKQIMADYWVTDAELAQAQDDYRACLEEWPTDVEVVFEADGTVVGPSPEDPDEQARFDEFTQGCGSRVFDSVDLYHRQLRSNPEGLTYAQAVRACFEENGVPDGAGLPDAEFERLVLGEDGGDVHEPESQAGRDCIRQPFPGG